MLSHKHLSCPIDTKVYRNNCIVFIPLNKKRCNSRHYDTGMKLAITYKKLEQELVKQKERKEKYEKIDHDFMSYRDISLHHLIGISGTR